MIKSVKTLTLIVFCFTSNLIQAATLMTDNTGQLLGAEGVIVDGMQYNVQFVEGNCNAGSPACVITFNNLTSATNASQALLDQVLTDSYDFFPQFTYGISATDYGYIFTPYKVDRGHILTQAAKNSAGIGDTILGITVDANVQPLFSYNSSGDIHSVFAVWTSTGIAAVPLPGAAWLMATGLGLIGMAGRRRRKC